MKTGNFDTLGCVEFKPEPENFVLPTIFARSGM
jgi:hypothetical protein